MGRQESPQLIERKTQVDADAHETSRASKYILTTCPYFDNLEFYIFDAGVFQCNFITSIAIAVRIPRLWVLL